MKLFAVFMAVALVLPAQDLTGRWIGVASSTDEAGTKREERHTLDIKSDDGKLTGVRLNRSGAGGSSLKVVQDGAKVNLYEYLTLDDGEHLRWKLELKEGKLVGSFSAMHDNPKKWIYDRIGSMTLSKADASTALPPAVK